MNFAKLVQVSAAMPNPDSSRDYHHGNLRQTLCTLALDHLRKDGLKHLSLRALAREIGVSPTAPYRHFKDKEALLQALAVEGFGRLREANLRAIAEADPNPESQLRAAGLSYLEFALGQPELFDLMFGPLLRQGSHDALHRAGDMSFAVLVEVIQQGIDQGVFNVDNAEAAANTAWALVHGLAHIGRAICPDWSPQEVQGLASESMHLLLRGLTRP
ncbi:MAG: TetR/AcrR family transcriptional regulator [Pseudomonadota bacterium]|nr:TetR/AcrR family transcriptional regulator [Pseudomonadota bacterium]